MTTGTTDADGWTTGMKWCYAIAVLLLCVAFFRVYVDEEKLSAAAAPFMAIILSLFIVFFRVIEMECRFNIHLKDEREK